MYFLLGVHFLGIDDSNLEGGLAGALVVIMLWLARTIYHQATSKSKEDSARIGLEEKQIRLEQTLTDLVAESIAEGKLVRLAYQANTKVLSTVSENLGALTGLITSVTASYDKKLDTLEELIRERADQTDALLRQVGEKVETIGTATEDGLVIQFIDSTGNIISTMTAVPHIKEGSFSSTYIVRIDEPEKEEE